MLTTVYSPKGGSGTTTVAATLALRMAVNTAGVTLVDAAEHGDIPAVLGLSDTYWGGFSEWSWAAGEPVELFNRLRHGINGSLFLVHRGAEQINARVMPQMRAVTENAHVVMDCGGNADLANLGDRRFMVLRADYLALKRAMNFGTHPTGIVLIDEPGRALQVSDMEEVIGCGKTKVVARIPFDPRIPRTIDAGLLAARQPKILTDAIRDLVIEGVRV